MISNKRLLKNIALVGSTDYQRRWCVHGTADEYVLLDELIETTIYSAKHRATQPVLSKNLTERERIALVAFHDHVDRLFAEVCWNDPSISIEEIVEHNETMKQIRQAANECLQELGVTFTSEELLRN